MVKFVCVLDYRESIVHFCGSAAYKRICTMSGLPGESWGLPKEDMNDANFLFQQFGHLLTF